MMSTFAFLTGAWPFMMLMRFIVANINVLTHFRAKIIGFMVEYQGQLIECYLAISICPNCDGRKPT